MKISFSGLILLYVCVYMKLVGSMLRLLSCLSAPEEGRYQGIVTKALFIEIYTSVKGRNEMRSLLDSCSRVRMSRQCLCINK